MLRLQKINPINGIRRRVNLSFFSREKKKFDKKIASKVPSAEEPISKAANNSKKKPTNPRDVILAEKERVYAIKKLIDGKDYNAALSNLMSDTDADFHYFNQVKSETLGKDHDDAFLRKHGKLKDFLERPAPIFEPGTCIWAGVNNFGQPLRCHNKSMLHPIERVADQLGVERPKPLDFCVYHVKYCVNTENHTIPVKICVANEMSLCNECFVLQNGHPPQELLRVPGTRRKRG